ncbi:MAG: AAA family ATPase [Anaerolineae bacterium]|nr:AAA family ATPase [Anaerolineae bacterium]
MPNFPHYDGPPLPEALNPRNPRHYLLLLDWLYLKPSRLKHYLHRADPELYFEEGWPALKRAVRMPAYRDVALMTLILTLMLTSLLVLGEPLFLGTTVRWWGTILGVVGGMVFGMLGGVVWGMSYGIGWGIAFGSSFGMAVGGAFGIVWGISLSAKIGMLVGVLFGLMLVTALSVLFGEAGGVLGGIAVIVAFSVAWGIAFGAVFKNGWGIWFSVAFGVIFSVMASFGVMRSPFYVVEFLPMLWSWKRATLSEQRLMRHPALWDELIVLPSLGLTGLLSKTLVENWDAGLHAVFSLLSNPFQRDIVGRVFDIRWVSGRTFLDDFFNVLQAPSLSTCVIVPVEEMGNVSACSAQVVFLGVVARVFVDSYGGTNDTAKTSERLVWRLIHLRNKPYPSAVLLARFLLHLSLDNLEEKGVDGDLLSAALDAIRDLPHGAEVAGSLAALAEMARAEAFADVAQAYALAGGLPPSGDPELRPQVMQALRGLLDVAAEAQRFGQASSPATQAAAINRAVGLLEELSGYVAAIREPERHLLKLVIARWQSLAAKTAGQLGDRALREMAPATGRAPGIDGAARLATFWSRPAQPFANPYKAGAPVVPPLFVGREDIFARIREVWAGKADPDSIILYGHRRMGKSSILRNLGACAPPGALLVYADLKGETAFVQDTQRLLRGLADEVLAAAKAAGCALPEPSPGDYAALDEASLAFKRLLRQAVDGLPEDGSLILALDEFEGVDDAVRDGRIGREIYNYLRMLSQQPRVVLVFAGLHTLDEMSRDYREAFFGSYVNLPVSYLSPQAAGRVIARPSPDFALDYHPDVIAGVIAQTHGQPLLLQRICQELVNHVNHELFDLEREREARVLPEDLAAVLSDDFVRSETRYFEGIWSSQIAGKPAAEATLAALAAGPLDAAGLVAATALAPQDVAEALKYLKTRDLIAGADGAWDLLVPLMRRWLRLQNF